MNKKVHIISSSRDLDFSKSFKSLILSGANIDVSDIIDIDENTDLKEMEYDNHISVVIVTIGFYETPLCMGLLGKFVANNNKIYPIVFPPVNYNDLRGMLIGAQVDSIKNGNTLNELGDLLHHEQFSVASWNKEKAHFIAIYESEHNSAISQISLRSRTPFDPWNTIWRELRTLVSAKRLSASYGSQPYTFQISLGSYGYVVVDICNEGYLSHNPNNILSNHEMNSQKHPRSNLKGRAPIGLITIMASKPGLRKVKEPEFEDDDLFYKYIEWFTPTSHEIFINTLDELITLKQDFEDSKT